jgi:ribulose-5-phosphate 4-epimerase/fuculose-1-phosphate aldolase
MIPFMVPGSKECTEAVERHFAGSESHALLLQNHGLITIGADFQRAFNIAEEIDEAARIWLLTRGKAKAIPAGDVERIKKL